jgi:ABC-2 type transport system permease protein
MRGIVPILSRPSFLTFKNNWSKQSFANKHFWRDLLVVSCVVYLLFGLYKLSDKGFGILYKYNNLTEGFLPSIFNALLFTLLALVFFSSCTFSLTNFFLAEDLDLILAAPLSKLRFFLNKFLQIFVSSSWIIYISSLPCIAALSGIYGVNSRFYCELVLITLPLLTIPVAFAIICTTLATRYLSGNHLRIILPTLTVFLLLTVFSKSHTFFSNAQKKDIEHVLDILQNLQHLNNSWFSYSWFGDAVTAALFARPDHYYGHIALLYLFCAAVLYLSYLTIAYMHGTSLTRLKGGSRNLNLSSRHSQRFARIVLPFKDKPYRAILLKEFKVFARDFSHLIQISLILIICLFYLYNFQTVFNSKSYFTTSLLSWQYVTFLCNIAFGSLIITSLCTRFVYSCISLEGKSFWILQACPLKTEDVLWNKFKSWYGPVLVFSIVILVSGCFALQAEIPLIVLTLATCFITAYSTTALAVGLGSVFANFNWVHSAQIFASSGSLIFIFASLCLTGFNIIFLSALLFMSLMRFQLGLSDNSYYFLMAALAVIFVLGNYFVSRLFIRAGVRALNNKLA